MKALFPQKSSSSSAGCRISVTLATAALVIAAIFLLGGSNDFVSNGTTVVGNTASQATTVFQQIYDDKFWGDGGNGSGEGSTLENTKRTRLIVELLVTRYNINGMLDAPCGAMLWMPFAIERVRKYHPNFKYCGVDVVPTVIESNAQRFKKLKHYRFEVVDLAAQEVPEGYDLIWSRDALQHLSYELIVPALDNFAHSGAKYLAVGSYKLGNNRNIDTGDYFAIDLRQSPFNLDSPIDIMDEETSDGKLVLIYDVKYLKKQDFAKMRQRAGLPKL